MNESLAGNLLVASSLAEDPIFNRSVCLLVHDDDDGTMGVMLNRPMQPSPKQLLAMLESESGEETGRLRARGGSSAGDAEDPSRLLHFGGPLSGPVVAIHASSEYAEAETGSGIYVAAQKQHLEQLVRHRPGPYRLIVGHLGWSAAQLRDELARGIWHVVPATPEIVFAADHEMWTHLIRRATAGSVASWLGVRDVPGAAELN